MAEHMKMPFFHGVTDQLPEHSRAAGDGAAAAHDGAKGDGLHHHELHEDEGGGYHSKHTHPDGRVEHADHPTYEHAVEHMHEMHGKESGAESKDEEPGRKASDDFDDDDMAGSYGRAGCED
jgi:hypothetical protein